MSFPQTHLKLHILIGAEHAFGKLKHLQRAAC